MNSNSCFCNKCFDQFGYYNHLGGSYEFQLVFLQYIFDKNIAQIILYIKATVVFVCVGKPAIACSLWN